MTLTTLNHLVLRLMGGAIPLLPHMSLWNGQGLYVLPFNTGTQFLKCGSLNSLVPTVHIVALLYQGSAADQFIFCGPCIDLVINGCGLPQFWII